MKFTVFHVFSGSKDALATNSGGVETLLNIMLKNNSLRLFVAARKFEVIPEIITEVKPKQTSAQVKPAVAFPFFTYMLSNLFLGINHSIILSIRSLTNKNDYTIVFHVHDPIIAASLFLFSSKRLTNALYVSQFHSEYLKRLQIILPQNSLSKLTFWLCRFSEKICADRSDLVIAVNENIVNYLTKLGCPPQKIRSIPVFIDTAQYLDKLETFVPLIEVATGSFVITFVGRLTKEKNAETLIKAFSRIDPPVRGKMMLLIVGSGDQLPHLKSLAKSATNVVFLGHRTDINRILHYSDVSILPSFTEGFPFSLLEAMASGKAIVASNIPPITKIAKDGHTAILFDPHSPDQLKDAIIRLYNDKSLRKALGNNAKSKAELYDISAILPRVVFAYQEFAC